MVSRRFPKVNFIANQENVGFSKANNIGVAQARGEHICILNPDTVITEDTFTATLDFLKTKENPGAIGVRLINGAGHYLPESKRNLPTPKVSLNKMMGDGEAYYATHIEEEGEGEVAVLVGAFMCMKKSVYEEVGGFDERYFMYGEDIDLSYTITQAGYTNYYFGEQAIIHFKGESTIKNKKYRDRFYGAMHLFYEKHLSKGPIEKTAVSIGLKAVKFKSAITHRKGNDASKCQNTDVSTYHVVTDKDMLKSAFAKAVSSPTTSSKEVVGDRQGSQIVFDTTFISYKQCITAIIKLRNSGLTFKIIPKNGTFAIGSNSSEGRGDVIQFEG